MAEDKTSLSHVLKDLGESSSLHGVPKILTSRQIAVKVMWCVLLIGAIGLSAYHIAVLFEEYNSFPVKTTVSLSYGKLPFPSVTICNSNPIRDSKISEYDEIFDLLYQQIDSKNMDQYDDKPLRMKLTGEVFSLKNYEPGSERGLYALRNLSTDIRFDVGHQLADMVYKVTFRGLEYILHENNTKAIQSPLYGNCYIIDLQEASQTSGPAEGMRLILNLEVGDYIEEFVNGYGMRISINQQGTFPIPEKESFLLNPGFETNVGIKLSKISRLDGVYGECTNGDGHQTIEDHAYSVPVCHAICLRDNVRKTCGCTPYDSPEDSNPYFKNIICNVDDSHEMTCVKSVEKDIHIGNLKCDCPPRCFEDTYRKVVTSRKWPSSFYLKHIVKDTCNSLETYWTMLCINFRRKYLNGFRFTSDDYDYFASNFLAVNIYFEDLNYEKITEQPAYGTVRFMSDIGGAMGLYIGASILTYVEIIQLILEMYIYFKKVFKDRHNRVRHLQA